MQQTTKIIHRDVITQAEGGNFLFCQGEEIDLDSHDSGYSGLTEPRKTSEMGRPAASLLTVGMESGPRGHGRPPTWRG